MMTEVFADPSSKTLIRLALRSMQSLSGKKAQNFRPFDALFVRDLEPTESQSLVWLLTALKLDRIDC